MKATNQFDYPTAAATTFKGYRQEQTPKTDKKVLYQKVLKQESQSEREKVQMEQQRRKELQAQQQQARLREQIQRKRSQLMQLQRKKQEALQNQRRAEQLANIKMHQDKIKRFEQEQLTKQYDDNKNYRFREALRRLDFEREELNIKERQAQQRRKTNQEVEKVERKQAAQYAEYLKEKEEAQRASAQQEQKASLELYRATGGKHGFSKNIDYSKTCFHNPQLVFKYQQQQQTNAISRGEEQERRQKQLSRQRRERQAQGRRRSLERGQKALQRIQAERQYRNYAEQAQKEQISYNLQRIEAGKKSQHTGIKPLTLQQMQLNKKARSEQQFEQMFVGSREAPSSNFASKYTILEAKYSPLPQNNFSRSKDTPQESSLEVYNPNYQHILDEEEDSVMEPRQIQREPTAMVDKRPMAETRADQRQRNYAKEQLSYSQSQDEA